MTALQYALKRVPAHRRRHGYIAVETVNCGVCRGLLELRYNSNDAHVYFLTRDLAAFRFIVQEELAVYADREMKRSIVEALIYTAPHNRCDMQVCCKGETANGAPVNSFELELFNIFYPIIRSEMVSHFIPEFTRRPGAPYYLILFEDKDVTKIEQDICLSLNTIINTINLSRE